MKGNHKTNNKSGISLIQFFVLTFGGGEGVVEGGVLDGAFTVRTPLELRQLHASYN